MIFKYFLIMFGLCFLIPAAAFAIKLTIAIVKMFKWENNLDRYKPEPSGSVINRQGVRLITAKNLLDDLKGIEEPSAIKSGEAK